MFPKTQAIIKKFQQENVFPGAVYGFITPEKEASYVIGNAQITPIVRPMEEDFLFDVASLTKVICTTTVVLKLIEKKPIDIDAPLKNYLSPFQNQEITLRHLLTHTSDIQTYIPNRDQLNADELRQAYYKLDSGKELGKKVQYTDAGTILLGFMLEEMFQKSAVEIFQDEVLVPLKMTDSCFLPQDKSKIVATEKIAELGVLQGITHDPKARILGAHAGNAGLFTNMKDVKKFAKMYLDFGATENEQFLKSETIEKLLHDHTPLKNGQRSLGWDLRYKNQAGKPMLFHTGYTGTFLLLDIFSGCAFIFLSNRVHPVDHRQEYIQKRDEILAIYLKEQAE